MKSENNRRLKYLTLLVFLTASFVNHLQSQPVVGLDNWFNHETNPKTGQPFHYLWTDTDWSGYSRWGEIFTSMGSVITTIQKPTFKSLKELDIYIIVDPDSTSESRSPDYISKNDIKAITKWIKNGGVLAVMANDGPNCEFYHLNSLMGVFGMAFNHTTYHSVTGTTFETGASTNLPDHPIFAGVTKIFTKEVSDIRISGNAVAVLAENGKVLMAECSYGKGFVFAVGDPWIYNEYIDHDRLPSDFQNRKAAENLTRFLLGKVKSQ